MREVGNEVVPFRNTSSTPETTQQVITVSSRDERTPSTQDTHYLDVAEGGSSELYPQEAWLPITESRDGNMYTCMFHLLSSGIGVQHLLLPVAFASLGWSWGIICLSLAFAWQLYTIWILVQLHETRDIPGPRCSRYLQLAMAAFGPMLGKLAALFPVMYLSGGTCAVLVITGGSNLNLLLKTVAGEAIAKSSLSGAEWSLVFTCVALALALQRPNLNSISGISFIGALTAISYSTLIWAISVSKDRPTGVSYSTLKGVESDHVATLSAILNALGTIALAFRGHNLVLEIQGTLPSSPKVASREPMWRAVTISYTVISMCMFPLAIAGFWAYGNQVPSTGGLLSAFMQLHSHDTSKYARGLICLLVVISCLSSFQIYAMPVFDNLELKYIRIKKERCPTWVRAGFRLLFGGLVYLVAVAFPFLPSLAPLLGGITLPLTLAYPCFMWILIRKNKDYGPMWWINLGLGCLGMALSGLLVFGAVRTLATEGLNANFFNPH